MPFCAILHLNQKKTFCFVHVEVFQMYSLNRPTMKRHITMAELMQCWPI